MTKYWAHSDPNGLPPESPGSRWQGLAQHLEETATLAEGFAEAAAPGNAVFAARARSTGALHDIGKYSSRFQHLVALSTYLGHSDIRNTYWYLEATPTLLADIADACERFVNGGSA